MRQEELNDNYIRRKSDLLLKSLRTLPIKKTESLFRRKLAEGASVKDSDGHAHHET